MNITSIYGDNLDIGNWIYLNGDYEIIGINTKKGIITAREIFFHNNRYEYGEIREFTKNEISGAELNIDLWEKYN